VLTIGSFNRGNCSLTLYISYQTVHFDFKFPDIENISEDLTPVSAARSGTAEGAVVEQHGRPLPRMHSLVAEDNFGIYI